MLFNATNPAAYSRLPSASSFHTTTMAMQRARPIRIKPIIYAGWPCKKTIAKKNMRIGPITQFSNKETPKTRVFLKTSFSLSYLTFVKGGYIINIKPIANGILVVPEEKELIKVDDDGMK